jgi:hypothetical protein
VDALVRLIADLAVDAGAVSDRLASTEGFGQRVRRRDVDA